MRARLKPDGVRTEMPKEGRKDTEKCGGGGGQDKPRPCPPRASEALAEVRAASA